MNTPLQTFEQTLKAAGHSITEPRKSVFEALLHKEPQTMAAVVDACASKVNRASIYRIVALFERLGVIHRLPDGWKYRLELTDAFHPHHHHLTCTQCGATTILPEDDELEYKLNAIATQQGYIITGHQLEVKGLCAACHP